MRQVDPGRPSRARFGGHAARLAVAVMAVALCAALTAPSALAANLKFVVNTTADANAAGCPSTDQRGVSRPDEPADNGACDIGAYESHGVG
jgi:hypothetical protein